MMAAFGLYWLSALVLELRSEVNFFCADTVLYAELAKCSLIERLGSYYPVDRITRFHPVTTGLAFVWMKALGPLAPWITPQNLLKAMFAAVGAVGVGRRCGPSWRSFRGAMPPCGARSTAPRSASGISPASRNRRSSPPRWPHSTSQPISTSEGDGRCVGRCS